MNIILKNILAILVGWIIGSLVNIGLIQLGYQVIPVEGIDPNDFEALGEVIHGLPFRNFIFPFLAHAVGTFIGGFLTALLATSRKVSMAMVIGFIFLAGGVAMAIMLDAPVWFEIVDLVFAYLPMAYFGGIWAKSFSKNPDNEEEE